MGTQETLIAQGWKLYPDQFRPEDKMWCKRFPTTYRCSCNDEKEGMQVELYVSNFRGVESFELQLCGELPDGSWFKQLHYALPSELEDVLLLIPRLLKVWDFANKDYQDNL